MANAVQILITAKDEASGVVKSMAGNVTDHVSSMSENVEKGMKRASVALAAISVGLTLYANNATKYMVDTVNSAKALSRQTGDTVENASRLNYALQKLGLSGDQTTTMFNSLSKNIKANNEQSADAALKQATLQNKIESTRIEVSKLTAEQVKSGDKTGALQTKIDGLKLAMQGYEKQIKDTGTPLAELGVLTKNADGSSRAFSDVLFDIADRFKGMPDGVAKTNSALEIFGRSGSDMVKILNKGSDGIKEMMAQADKLGLTITAKNITAVDAYIKSQKELKDTTDSLKMSVAELTTPVMTKYNQMIADLVKKLVGADAPTRELTANVLAFGGQIAGGASAVVGFAANIASAMPLLGKFGKTGAASATGVGNLATQTTALSVGARALPLLLNPTVIMLGTLAAAAGAGYLVWQKYFKATEDVKNSLGDTAQKSRGFATSMNIVTAAQQNQTHAENEALDATTRLTSITYQHKAALEEISKRAMTVAQAQDSVKLAMDKYGASSPQYIAAVKTLHDRQDELNASKFRELDLSLQLTPANNDLAAARDVLTEATYNLHAAQDFLNNGLDGSLGRIAQFGPTAINQVAAVGTLQNAVATLAGSWNGFVGGFQAQSDYVSLRLTGNTKTAQQLQSTINNINKSSGVQFTGNSMGLQGAGGVQGFAEGGYTGAGPSNAIAGVVHRGEYVLPQSQVDQATGTPKASSAGGSPINVTNYISNNVDIESMLRDLSWRLRTA